ncbi:MAG: polysaccharide biosynthesis/export family protein [Pseudomonadota bacterium]
MATVKIDVKKALPLLLLVLLATPVGLWAADTIPPVPYRIGPGDTLEVVVWREEAVTRSDILVRPDGRISMPLVDDITAAGMTPMELKELLTKTLSKLIETPYVYVIIRDPYSYSFSVIGNVKQPGRFTLLTPTNVLQAIAEAEGFNEWAHKDDIVIMRGRGPSQTRLPFSYSDVLSGKNLNQNIEIKPGDVVIVP